MSWDPEVEGLFTFPHFPLLLPRLLFLYVCVYVDFSMLASLSAVENHTGHDTTHTLVSLWWWCVALPEVFWAQFHFHFTELLIISSASAQNPGCASHLSFDSVGGDL